MKSTLGATLAVTAVCVSVTIVLAASPEQKISVETAPPVVVSTTPVAGATDVLVTTDEIRVTYSKPMKDKSWSWSQVSPDTFPSAAGEPSYDKDGCTAVLPVKLEAGQTYAIWLNSQRFSNFKDREGRSAVPYLLVFETVEAK